MLLVTMCAPAIGADGPPVLTPEPARITDRTISSDIRTINEIQKRLADINTQGTAIGSYHFAKAQAWLDMAMDEYAMNDRTSVTEDALRQAFQVIAQLEAKKGDIGMETAILPTSRLVRPDLWRTAGELKKHPGFSCGEDLVARLEVQLVWAGHEENQLGWRHAKPYLQAAERLAGDARRAIEACPDGQAAASGKPAQPAGVVEARDGEASAAPVCPSCPPPVATGTESRAGGTPRLPAGVGEETPDRVHFAINRTTISARSAAILERLAMVLRANPGVGVELQGHADERGNEAFNRILSRSRAEVVRTYLVAAGVERSRIMVKAFGVARPVMRGNDIVSFARNRRVEFVFPGGEGIVRPFAQYEDLQVEGKRDASR
jgi:outer membrane protein OmpA-like peptidoglycan-associated protein